MGWASCTSNETVPCSQSICLVARWLAPEMDGLDRMGRMRISKALNRGFWFFHLPNEPKERYPQYLRPYIQPYEKIRKY